ncbi:hypothetical protein [Microbulbifer sp. JTAC008]|uniref:hypothetical protein n=1 Tax=unclassified Microbulbifer TaxID=2619833 RepID=UPI00403A19B5
MKLNSNYLVQTMLMGLALFGGGAYSSASTITPSSIHSSEISLVDNESVDTLRVRPANSNGISWNQFNTFSVSGQPLQLLNIPGLLEDSTPVEAASLIVIIADRISLSGLVEVMGAPADVLFLSKDENGSINCLNCSFSNIPRITMAAAQPSKTISDNVADIGELTATSGSISLSGMSAPGALLVETLSDELFISGALDIHQPASKDSNGLVPDENGNYLLGTGLVNAMAGDISWNYDLQKIENIIPKSGAVSQKLEGSIRAAAVKLTTANCLTLDTEIDTTSDFLSSVRYQNQVVLSGESVEVQTFGVCDTTVTEDMTSNGDITIKSNGSLLFPSSNVNIEGKGVTAIANGRLENKSEIFAHTLKVASDEIVNFGLLEGGSTLSAWADNNVYNQFGGKITGGVVDVQSQNGFVRNGSRTPYLPNESSVDDLLTFYAGDLTLEKPETSEFGTYYRSGINVSTTSNFSQPSDTSAHIIGEYVRIKAKGVENINPYWEKVSDDKTTVLLRSLVNQTTISGENGIEIQAQNYLLNSSAVLRLNKGSGTLKLEGKYIVNERYRNLTLLDQTYYTILDGNTTENIETYETRAYTYSPPGIIVSLGDLETYATAGLVNNAAYLEVYGQALFDTPVVHDYGISHKAISKETATTKVYLCEDSRGPGTVFVPCFGGDDYVPVMSGNEIVVAEPKDADSLFFVHGNVKGSGEFESITHNTFDGFQEVAIADLFESHAPEWWEDEYYYMSPLAFGPVDGKIPVLGGGYITDQSFTTDIQMFEDTLELFWIHDWYYESTESSCSTSTCMPITIPSGDRNKTESETFSLFEIMKDMYNSIKSTISDFVSEFDWWS